MVSTLWNDAPALSTVHKWAAEFRREGSLDDNPGYECSATATTEENIDCIHYMDDRQLTVN